MRNFQNIKKKMESLKLKRILMYFKSNLKMVSYQTTFFILLISCCNHEFVNKTVFQKKKKYKN